MAKPSKAVAARGAAKARTSQNGPDGSRVTGRHVAVQPPIATPAAAPGAPDEEWFGPGRPLPPFAPPSTAGRRMDFQFGQNMQVRPRWDQLVSFPHLRALADGHDLTRLAIETRKDQMSRLQWTFGVVDSDEEPSAEQATRVAALRALFRRPDGENFWTDWLRMLLEDMLVLDAPAVFIRRTMDRSEIVGLYQVDGATIMPLIDNLGRTPEPPKPAYQQVLHGIPAVDYTSDDMVYRPRNRRVHTVWGYSPVEQIIATINIALRRQIWQHAYFTNGNIPDSLIGVPGTWSPDQIREFQDWFDALLTGATERRRGAIFVPGEVAKSYVPTKDAEMFGQGEEWLARVVCFCFSISHQALVKEVNRATAENAREQALQDGLAPVMGWVKSTIDGILIDHFGETELEFVWIDDKELDPKVQDDIWAGRVDRGAVSRNEWRAAVGEQPRPEPEADMLLTTGAQAAVPLAVPTGDDTDPEAPVSGASPTAGGAPALAPGDSVQAQALNGAQVQALLEMVQSVIARELATDTAVELISIAFPVVPPERIRALVTAAARQPEPEPAPAQAPLDQQTDDSGGVVAPEGPGGGVASSAPPPPTKAEVAEQGDRPFVAEKAGVRPSDRQQRRLLPSRPSAQKLRRQLQAVLAAGLEEMRTRVIASVTTRLGTLTRVLADDEEELIREALAALGSWDFLIDPSAAVLEELARDTVRVVAAALGGPLASSLVDQVSDRAVAWARERAAELVGRRVLVDGSIVDNPDARWAITEATRDMIRDTITTVLEQNQGSDTIIQSLQDDHAFSPARAEMVSRTEVAGVNSRAAMDTYHAARSAGVSVRKEWLLGPAPCDICQENADAGPIELDDDFPSGDSEPGAHPNCECAVAPVVDDETTTTTDEE